jgi:hypothetical protein
MPAKAEIITTAIGTLLIRFVPSACPWVRNESIAVDPVTGQKTISVDHNPDTLRWGLALEYNRAPYGYCLETCFGK